MSRLLFVLFFAIPATTSYSQSTFNTSIDLLGYDGNDRGIGIAADETGFYIYQSGSCAQNTIPCSGLIKVNNAGQVLWSRVFSDSLHAISATFQDGIALHEGFIYLTGMAGLEPLNNQFFVKKLDTTNGNIVWEKMFRPDSLSAIKTLQIKANGHLLVYGQTGTSDNQHLYLQELDAAGTQQWAQIIDVPNDAKLNYFGNADLSPTEAIAMAYVTIPEGAGGQGAGLAVSDPLGNVGWTRNFDEEVNPHTIGCPRRIRTLPNGGFVYQHCTDDVPYDGDNLLFSLDTAGDIEWEYVFDGYARKIITNFIIAANGDILGCGIDFNFPLNGDPTDLTSSGWVFRMTPAGELLWERNFYQPKSDWLPANFDAITETPSGLIALTGRIGAEFPDGQRHSDIWLMVLDESGCLQPDCAEQYIVVSDQEIVAPEKRVEFYFNTFPNPASDQLYFVLGGQPIFKNGLLRLFSATGQLVRQKEIQMGDKQSTLEVSNLPVGLYLLSLEVEGKVFQTEKILISGKI